MPARISRAVTHAARVQLRLRHLVSEGVLNVYSAWGGRAGFMEDSAP